MKIRRINDTTINCIITQEDLRQKGIELGDLFDRKKEAVDFIRETVAEAVRETDFQGQSEFTCMRLSVLPDKSVSLTISQDPSESKRISSTVEEVTGTKRYLYEFDSIRSLIPACRDLLGLRGLSSDVYQPQGKDTYFLLLTKGEDAGDDFEPRVLRVNEFADIRSTDEASLRSLVEHARVICAGNAVETLSALDADARKISVETD